MKPIIILFFTFVSSFASAQSDTMAHWPIRYDDKDVGIVLGAHQFRSTFFELGVAYTKRGGRGCAFGSYFNGYSLSAEYNPFQNRGGLALSAWKSLGTIITSGITINSFCDFTYYNLGINPFIGIGPGHWSLTYGYNFQLISNNVTDINRHCFSFRYYLPVKSF